jgi:hypothetical protein
MASFDLGSLLGAKPAIGPVSVATSNVNSVAVDTSGFSAVAFVSAVGTGNTNATINAVHHFWESDDATIGNATRLSSDRVISNPTLNASNSTFIASVVPTKRYVFTELDPSGAFTSLVCVTAVLKGNEAPV